jgi:hypothetical protein
VSDEYLWDGTGPVDRDVRELERLLAPLRSAPPVPHVAPTRTPRVAWRRLLPPLAVAATILLGILVERRVLAPADTAGQAPSRPPAASRLPAAGGWVVTGVDAGASGQPGQTTLSPFRVGATLTTTDGSRARLVSPDIGEVVVEPATRVRLVASGDGRERLALERGALQAFIVAPPGRFVVETPSATAVDLGCVYTLRVGEDGDGVLTVNAGWVAFELNGRESFVPAGASCPTRASTGPGLPRFEDASPGFVRAIDAFEAADEPRGRVAALRAAARGARPRDAMTLWHLIARATPAERPIIVQAMRERVPLPRGVEVEAVMRLDAASLDQWWDALGLGEARTWREWRRPLPLAR